MSTWNRIDPDWERPTPPRASLRRDIWAWVLILGISLLYNASFHSSGLYGSDPDDIRASYLVVSAMTLPLMTRRRYPIATLIVATAIFFGIGSLSQIAVSTLSSQLCYFTALYSAVAWAKNRAMLWIVYTLVCVSVFLWIVMIWVTMGSTFNLFGVEDYRGGLFSLPTAAYIVTALSNTCFFGLAGALGRTAWREAYQRHILAQQAAQLEAQAVQIAQDAVHKDRLRIARELHDSVGHHVSSMGIQAAAARRALEKKPELAAQPLQNIEKLARSSVAEMKNLIRVLRESDAEPGTTAKEPQIADIHTLAQTMRESGIETQIQINAGSEKKLEGLHQGTQLSIYRMAQEALTNVRKHSSARSVILALRTGGIGENTWVELEVTDDGTCAESGQVGAAPGYGLQGIRERAAALGGSAQIGPRTGAEGWRVLVRFPVRFEDYQEEK
ncbi:sensor histidine kinase [Rothia sp. CCM 9417]|uniref:sensor histidine kinase n=1 Tax=Rothia sp. CCM 9417 TaxID=3402657 RepID=UPI003AE17EBC